MKLLHTSDWHIGHTLYAKKRYDEHEKFLSWLVETICRRDIDALIVAGDVFDTGAPGGAAQRLYYGFLTSLLGTCCKTVIIIAGNHDSPALIEAPAGVLEHLDIHTVGLPSAPQRHVIKLKDKDGNTAALCCAVPYLRKNEMVRLSDDALTSDEMIALETARFYRETADEALRLKKECGEVPIVATGHLFAAGALRTEGDGVRELYVGSLGQVAADIFPKAFDYIALGHIHGAQVVANQPHIRYCGSPLPMSFAETGREKYVIEAELDGSGLNIQPIAVPVFQTLHRISGSREQIMAQLAAIAGEDVWIEVTYTDTTPCPFLSADVFNAVKGGLAQVLSIRNAAAVSEMLSDAGNETLESLSVQEVFLRCLNSAAFSDEERQALISCFDEAVRMLEDEESCA